MPEPASYRADIDASRDQLGGRVVPKLVQRGLDLQLASHAVVSLRDGIRDRRGTAIRRTREDVRISREFDAKRSDVAATSPQVLT